MNARGEDDAGLVAFADAQTLRRYF